MWNIGEAIKDLRESKNLSRKDLAEKLNVSSKTISNYENGTREPSLEMVKDLSIFFNTSVDYLLSGHFNIDKPNEFITIKFKNGNKEPFDIKLLQELIDQLENNKINAESIIKEINEQN